MARLKETYLNEIVDAMMKKFEYKNVMQVPKLDKIVINMGVGEAKENSKVLDTAISDLDYHWSEGGCYKSKEIRRKLQTA